MLSSATAKQQRQRNYKVENGNKNQDFSNTETQNREFKERSDGSAKFPATSSKTRQKCLKESREIETANHFNEPIERAGRVKRKRENKQEVRTRTRDGHKKLTCTTCCSLVSTPSSTSSFPSNLSHEGGSSYSQSELNSPNSKSNFKSKSESNFESLYNRAASKLQSSSSLPGSLWSVSHPNNLSLSYLIEYKAIKDSTLASDLLKVEGVTANENIISSNEQQGRTNKKRPRQLAISTVKSSQHSDKTTREQAKHQKR